MYKGGGTRPMPSKKQKETTKRKDKTRLRKGSPCLSLAKSTDNDAGMLWYQVVASNSSPIAAIVSTQQFPSR